MPTRNRKRLIRWAYHNRLQEVALLVSSLHSVRNSSSILKPSTAKGTMNFKALRQSYRRPSKVATHPGLPIKERVSSTSKKQSFDSKFLVQEILDSSEQSVASSISSPTYTDWDAKIRAKKKLKHKKLLKEKMMKSMEQSKQQQTTHAPTSIKKTHTGPRRVPPLDDDEIEYILNSQMNKRAPPPSSAARAAAIRDSFSTERTSASWKERRRHTTSDILPSTADNTNNDITNEMRLKKSTSSRWGSALERFQQSNENLNSSYPPSSSNDQGTTITDDEEEEDDLDEAVQIMIQHKPSIHRRRSMGDIPITDREELDILKRAVHFSKSNTNITESTSSVSSTSSSKEYKKDVRRLADTSFDSRVRTEEKEINNKHHKMYKSRKSSSGIPPFRYIHIVNHDDNEYDDDNDSVSSLESSSIHSTCTENDWNLLVDARKSLGGISMEISRVRRHSIRECSREEKSVSVVQSIDQYDILNA